MFITKERVIHSIDKMDKFIYDPYDDTIKWQESGEYCAIKLDDFVEFLKKTTGQSFECIYDEHALLYSVLRCTECGTVVFYKYDEGYEPDFKCPVCTNYSTKYEFYTAQQIEASSELKQIVARYENMARLDSEREDREKRRGLLDHEIWKRSYMHGYKSKTTWALCREFGVHSGIRGLHLTIEKWVIDDTLGIFVSKKNPIDIPLSISNFYQRFLYRHLER